MSNERRFLFHLAGTHPSGTAIGGPLVIIASRPSLIRGCGSMSAHYANRIANHPPLQLPIQDVLVLNLERGANMHLEAQQPLRYKILCVFINHRAD